MVARNAIDAKVAELSDRLGSLAPLAVCGRKRTNGADAARQRIAACFASADSAEGLAAQRQRLI